MEQEQNSTVEQPVAAKPKEDKNATLKALCMFFAILALGVGGFILYDKVIARKDEPKCVEALKKDEEKSEDGNAEEGQPEEEPASKMAGSVQIRGDYGYGPRAMYYFTSDGNVYARFYHKWTPFKFKSADGIGEWGKYTIDSAKLGDWRPSQSITDDTEFVLEDAYKLDLKNVMFSCEMLYGQAMVKAYEAFIDTKGNMSVLVIANESDMGYQGDSSDYARLYKNIEKDVMSVSVVEGSGYIYSLVHYRDGSQKPFNFDKLK